MTRLLILVEGQSEEIFVKRTLTPYLAQFGVYARTIVLWTKRMSDGGGFRGGVSHWEQIRKSLMPLTKDADAWITTLLDFYGLPDDFPGYGEAFGAADPRKAVIDLQTRFAAEVRHERLIPFLALHEFEAWIFSAPETVADHFSRAILADKVRNAVKEAGEPELINHGEHTHPKARLRNLSSGYKETSDGPMLLDKIGIPVIKRSCPHFAAWLSQLELLGREA